MSRIVPQSLLTQRPLFKDLFLHRFASGELVLSKLLSVVRRVIIEFEKVRLKVIVS